MPSGAIGATDPRGRRAALPSPALAAGAQPCAQEGPGARLWRPSGACPVEQKGGAWCDPQIRHAADSPRRLSESGAKRGARPPKQSPDRGFFPPTENHLPVTGRGSPAEPGTERCSAPRRLGGGSQSEPALNRTPVRIALRRGRDRGWPPGRVRGRRGCPPQPSLWPHVHHVGWEAPTDPAAARRLQGLVPSMVLVPFSFPQRRGHSQYLPSPPRGEIVNLPVFYYFALTHLKPQSFLSMAVVTETRV